MSLIVAEEFFYQSRSPHMNIGLDNGNLNILFKHLKRINMSQFVLVFTQ